MDTAPPQQKVREVSPRAVKVVVKCVVFFVLATITVSFRSWARKIKGLFLCFNDYAINAAFVRSPCSVRVLHIDIYFLARG